MSRSRPRPRSARRRRRAPRRPRPRVPPRSRGSAAARSRSAGASRAGRPPPRSHRRAAASGSRRGWRRRRRLARRSIRPIVIPSACRDVVVTRRRTRGSPGSPRRARSRAAASRRRTRRPRRPAVGDVGQRPAENTASRLAGEEAAERAELPLVRDSHRHPVDSGHRGDLYGVADDEERVVLAARVAARGYVKRTRKSGLQASSSRTSAG